MSSSRTPRTSTHDGDGGHEAAGRGKLDYDRYLSLLHRCGFRGAILLHGLSEAQVPECVAFLRGKLARIQDVRAKDPFVQKMRLHRIICKYVDRAIL